MFKPEKRNELCSEWHLEKIWDYILMVWILVDYYESLCKPRKVKVILPKYAISSILLLSFFYGRSVSELQFPVNLAVLVSLSNAITVHSSWLEQARKQSARSVSLNSSSPTITGTISVCLVNVKVGQPENRVKIIIQY